ncbi:MAG: cytochrome c family protein [bacterium]
MQKIFWLVLVLIFAFAGAVQSQEKKENPEYSFIGTKGCKKCHIKQFKSWKETKMANAYEILKPGERAEAKKNAGLDPEKDYTKDAECLACHTTGYGKPGGFVSLEKTPQLVGVSCEMCHGAGSEYTKVQYMHLKNKNYKLAEVVKVGLIAPVTGDRCTEVCHNEKSPFFKKDEPFDFEKRKEQGTHKHFPLKYKHD